MPYTRLQTHHVAKELLVKNNRDCLVMVMVVLVDLVDNLSTDERPAKQCPSCQPHQSIASSSQPCQPTASSSEPCQPTASSSQPCQPTASSSEPTVYLLYTCIRIEQDVHIVVSIFSEELWYSID